MKTQMSLTRKFGCSHKPSNENEQNLRESSILFSFNFPNNAHYTSKVRISYMNVHKKIIINSKDSIRKKQNAWAWLDEGTDIILLYVNTTQ